VAGGAPGTATSRVGQTDSVDGSHVPLSDESIAALQEAARGAVAAARGILDAIEVAIEDQDRVVAFVEGVTDVLRTITSVVGDIKESVAFADSSEGSSSGR